MANPQSVLPSMPSWPPRPTLKDWVEEWITVHCPNGQQVSMDARAEMYWWLPNGLVPKEQAYWGWFVSRFRQTVQALGYAYPHGSDSAEVVQQLAMPWPDFQTFCFGRVVHASEDLDAVERDVREYVTFHQLVVDVPRLMGAWKQAAGL